MREIKNEFFGKNLSEFLKKWIENQKIEVPLDDEKVFETLKKGKTSGLYLLDDRYARRLLKEFKPETFKDLFLFVAIYKAYKIVYDREMVKAFLKGRKDPASIDYIHPELEPIISETYGIIIFKDQIEEILTKIGGFSKKDAEKLRKALGKLDLFEIEKYGKKFIEGGVKRGIDKDTSYEILRSCSDYRIPQLEREYIMELTLLIYLQLYFNENIIKYAKEKKQKPICLSHIFANIEDDKFLNKLKRWVKKNGCSMMDGEGESILDIDFDIAIIDRRKIDKRAWDGYVAYTEEVNFRSRKEFIIKDDPLLILYDDIRDWKLPELTRIFQIKPDSKKADNFIFKILNTYLKF